MVTLLHSLRYYILFEIQSEGTFEIFIFLTIHSFDYLEIISWHNRFSYFSHFKCVLFSRFVLNIIIIILPVLLFKKMDYYYYYCYGWESKSSIRHCLMQCESESRCYFFFSFHKAFIILVI